MFQATSYLGCGRYSQSNDRSGVVRGLRLATGPPHGDYASELRIQGARAFNTLHAGLNGFSALSKVLVGVRNLLIGKIQKASGGRHVLLCDPHMLVLWRFRHAIKYGVGREA